MIQYTHTTNQGGHTMLLDKNDIVTAMRNEAYARCRYEVFAEIAKEKGLHYFAKVLKETADNELSHFKEFMRILDLIASITDSPLTAIS